MSSQDIYAQRMDAMEDRIDAAIAESQTGKGGFVKSLQRGKLPNKVIYSAYNTDDNDDPVDNLDDIPYEGTFNVVCEYGSFWDSSEGQQGGIYISPPVTNPTWLDLTVFANEAIHTTKDEHHVYFENVTLKDDKTLMLSFGS